MSIVKHLGYLGFRLTLWRCDFFLAPWLFGFWFLCLTLWFFSFCLAPSLVGPDPNLGFVLVLVIVVDALVLDATCLLAFECWDLYPQARLAQSVERKALNLVVVGSSPTVGGFWRIRSRSVFWVANVRNFVCDDLLPD